MAERLSPLPECPVQSGEFAALLLDYCTRTLSADAARRLEAHCAVCPACAAFRDQQRALWSALDEWDAAPLSLDFNRRLWARVEEQERLTLPQRALAWLDGVSMKPALPVAGAFALWMLLLIPPPPGLPPEASLAPPSERADIELVERQLEDLDMLAQLPLATE